ncbi:hypothetical protein [Burkholderia cepacia]|uniref:hypothetical protein n=1 Tax=Burkholderia cepacia TaxID=292 RepID=UPI0026E04F76|nr:hypothetical protein [Burkholderia cepacia]MDO5940624.1 hypothetical protein [Burkholderia cepacia]
MTPARIALISVLLALAAAVGGFFFGRHVEATAQHARASDKTISELGALLEANQDLIRDSQDASRKMREALTQRAAQDQKSTKELRDALAKTARSRADCRFDADSMRLIQAARDRAAATAAGGVLGAVPATASAGQR